eukprot:2292520-Amphidinium_carterae.1
MTTASVGDSDTTGKLLQATTINIRNNADLCCLMERDIHERDLRPRHPADIFRGKNIINLRIKYLVGFSLLTYLTLTGDLPQAHFDLPQLEVDLPPS